MRSTLTLLSIFLLLGSSVPRVSAQAAPPAAAVAAAPLRGDTAMAVHRMFQKHRIGGYIWTGIGAAFTLQVLVGSAANGFDDAGGTLVGIAVFGGVPGGIGLSKLSRFSRASEQLILADFQKYHKLPPYVEKRLKRSYFY